MRINWGSLRAPRLRGRSEGGACFLTKFPVGARLLPCCPNTKSLHFPQARNTHLVLACV